MDPIHSRADHSALNKIYSPNIPLSAKGPKYLFLHLQDESAGLYYFDSSELVHLHSSEIDISATDDHPPTGLNTSKTTGLGQSQTSAQTTGLNPSQTTSLNPSQTAGSEPSQTVEDRKDAFLHIFCHKIDKELVQILKEHPLPVFILGDPPVLRRYKKITRNAAFIVAYIPFIQPQKKPPEGGFYKTT